MNKKILALDLDGTLLSSEKTITPMDEAAINAMLDAGHILTIDSGRPVFGMMPIVNSYDFFKRESVYLLGIQGGLGYDLFNKKTMFVNHIDKKKAYELASLVKKENLCIFAFDEEYMYVWEDNEDVARYNKSSDCPVKVVSSPEDFKEIELCKIIVCSFNHPEELITFKEIYEDRFSAVFTSMFSCAYYLEYIKKGTDKGIGLGLLADHLGIPIEDTIACGDERNDISMIQAAGVGVCVANGQKEVKPLADYVTVNDNNHGAIAEVINKFIL